MKTTWDLNLDAIKAHLEDYRDIGSIGVRGVLNDTVFLGKRDEQTEDEDIAAVVAYCGPWLG